MNAMNPGHRPAATLERGRGLVEAQRQALVAGDLALLGRCNAELNEWLAAFAVNAARLHPGERAALASLRAAMAANGAALARASTHTSRALETLLAGPERTYGANGRSSTPGSLRPSLTA